VRIDRRRKIPVTTLLLALDNDTTWKKRAAAIAKNQTLDPSEAQGLSPERSWPRSTARSSTSAKRTAWNTPSTPSRSAA